MIHETPPPPPPAPAPAAKLMTDQALKIVKSSYDSVLESGNVWKLNSGRIVEQVMMNLAMELKYEHPAHSLIIKPDDVGIFSEQELEQIRDTNTIDFNQEIPQVLHEYLYSFINKQQTAEIRRDPVYSYLLYGPRHLIRWLKLICTGHGSVERTINLYNYKFFDDYVEDNVEYRIWPFVSECFDATEMRARSGKRKSQASSDRHNQSRLLSGHEPTARQASGIQPDMKCLYMNYELCFSEVGLKDEGESGTKELFESGMKAPKMLKDFFVSILRDQPTIVRSVKTAAFIISGLHMSAIIMYCPEGSVCRITQSERASFPLGPTTCSRQLIPILGLVYRVRQYLSETVTTIKDNGQIVSVGKKGKKRAIIPPSRSGSSSSIASTSSSVERAKKQRQL